MQQIEEKITRQGHKQTTEERQQMNYKQKWWIKTIVKIYCEN
jgi:hypothetical protein